MRSVQFHEYGGPDVLRVEDVPRPTPREDEVLIDVRAIGVNPTDGYAREGVRRPGAGAAHLDDENEEGGLPRIPGADVSGVVESVGQNVETVAVGDRVFGTGLHNDRQGTYAEYAVAREDRIARLPENTSFEVGGAIGVVGVTAWQALVTYAGLGPAETCLIHGASGGVGHVAVQLANQMGARVIATAGSERARTRVDELGADVVLDYDRTDLASAVTQAAPDGVDVILDPLLGTYLEFDIDVAGFGAEIVGVGGPQDTCTVSNLWPAFGNDLTLQIMSMSNTSDMSAVLRKLAYLLADDEITAHVAREFPLEDAHRAHRALHQESYIGKLILKP